MDHLAVSFVAERAFRWGAGAIRQWEGIAQPGHAFNGGVEIRPGQFYVTLPVRKIDRPVVFLLVGFDQFHDGAHRQPHPRRTDIGVVIIKDAIIDEDGHGVFVGQIGIHIDLVIRFHFPDPEIPSIPRLIR